MDLRERLDLLRRDCLYLERDNMDGNLDAPIDDVTDGTHSARAKINNAFEVIRALRAKAKGTENDTLTARKVLVMIDGFPTWAMVPMTIV